jgi:hypothetical protein
MIIGSFHKERIAEIYARNSENDIFRNSHSFSFYYPKEYYVTHVFKKLGLPNFETLEIPKGSYCIFSSSYEDTSLRIQPATKGSQLLWMCGYISSDRQKSLMEKYTYPHTDWHNYLLLREIQDAGYRDIHDRAACLFVDEYKRKVCFFSHNKVSFYSKITKDDYLITTQYPIDGHDPEINNLRHDRIYEIDLLNRKTESIQKLNTTLGHEE